MGRTLDHGGKAAEIKAKKKIDKSIRNSRVGFINPFVPPGGDIWSDEDARFLQSVFIRLVGFAHVCQGSTLRGSIPPLAAYPKESLQFTEYLVNMHYKEHQDSDGGNKEGRGSIDEPVVDHAESGGEFQFRDADLSDYKSQLNQRGTAVAFPSSAYHSVDKVLKGRRRSIVLWCNALKLVRNDGA